MSHTIQIEEGRTRIIVASASPEDISLQIENEADFEDCVVLLNEQEAIRVGLALLEYGGVDGTTIKEIRETFEL